MQCNHSIVRCAPPAPSLRNLLQVELEKDDASASRAASVPGVSVSDQRHGARQMDRSGAQLLDSASVAIDRDCLHVSDRFPWLDGLARESFFTLYPLLSQMHSPGEGHLPLRAQRHVPLVTLKRATTPAARADLMAENMVQLERCVSVLTAEAPALHTDFCCRVFGVEPSVAECRRFFLEMRLEEAVLMWTCLLALLEKEHGFSYEQLMATVLALPSDACRPQKRRTLPAVFVSKFCHCHFMFQNGATPMGSYYNLACSPSMRDLLGWDMQLLEEKGLGFNQLVDIQQIIDLVTHRVASASEYAEAASLAFPGTLDRQSILVHVFDVDRMLCLTATGHFLPCFGECFLVFSTTRLPMMFVCKLTALV